MKYTYEDYFGFMERNLGNFGIEERDEDGKICGFSYPTQHVYADNLSEIFDSFIDAEKIFGSGVSPVEDFIQQLENNLEMPTPPNNLEGLDAKDFNKYIRESLKPLFRIK